MSQVKSNLLQVLRQHRSSFGTENLEMFASYERESQFVDRALKVGFAVAGCLWIAFLFVRDQPEYLSAVVGQYRAYMLLLTLWGLEYRRREKRIALVSTFLLESRESGLSDSSSLSRSHFAIFNPAGLEFKKVWLTLGLNYVLSIGICYAIVKQILLFTRLLLLEL